MNSQPRSLGDQAFALGTAAALGILGVSILTNFSAIHRYIELFSHFKPQYLAVSLLFAVAFLFARRYYWVLVCLLSAAVNLLHIAPWYLGARAEQAGSAGQPLKIMLSNVHTANTAHDELLGLIRREQPDVFVAQEINARWQQALRPIEALLPYKRVVAREDNFGIAIYSKRAPSRIDTVYWGPSGLPSLSMEFSVGPQRVSLWSTHPLPPVSKEYYSSRNTQLHELAAGARRERGPLIVVGDLNVTMWSHVYRDLERTSGLVNARRGFGLRPTWPARLPWAMIPIDHCLVSPTITVQDFYTGPDIGSDHLPLIIRLRIKDTATGEPP